MRAGHLRHRIVIESSAPTRGASGSVVDAWATFCECWASKAPSRGRENEIASQVYSEAGVDWVIRWRSGVVPSMRVRYADPKDGTTRLYKIEAVDCTDERRIMLTLQTREIQG